MRIAGGVPDSVSWKITTGLSLAALACAGVRFGDGMKIQSPTVWRSVASVTATTLGESVFTTRKWYVPAASVMPGICTGPLKVRMVCLSSVVWAAAGGTQVTLNSTARIGAERQAIRLMFVTPLEREGCIRPD